jgi:hypothetical protein
MPTFSQLPGDLTITHVIGDEVSFTIDLDVNVTGYTFTAGVYVVSTQGFQGAGGGTSPGIGSTAFTPVITVANAANGTLTWGAGELQTVALSAGVRYRHFVRWIAPGGITRTIISGEYIPVAP